ncbi:hypothetical protein SAMN05216207_102645 [Pseudonocardia ammonioxydans]|uniref:DUF4190 domain-containing protein n=1 Tax=Pseudonocardia ammonioxydans TaxID=260086 RepID=A0A1I5DGU7_PSUAM|nr:hypothetical protein [Pseudonocardia ammonioxydans]SFN98475.1 hypothetical protein SAMN05216207_102645 [Pseudonocardia ammonioxydans]
MSSPPPYPGQPGDPQDPRHGYPEQPTQQFGQQDRFGQGQGPYDQQYGSYPGRPSAHDPGGYPGYGAGPSPAPPRNGAGVAALVLGILAVLTGLFLLGGLLGLIAIALGIVGITRASKGIATNRGVAIGGLVLGVIGVLMTVAVVVFAVFSLNLFNDIDQGQFMSCVQDAGSDQTALQQCQRDLEDRLQGELDQLGN